jgi:putative transcriptional regulator
MVNRELKILRCKQDLNQADVAKILNITISSYSRKENGKQGFSLKEAMIISKLFNKSIEEIFFAEMLQNVQESK